MSKKYSFDEVLQDILAFEGLLPYINYDSFKNIRYTFLYSDIFYNRLNSRNGYSDFYNRCEFYFKHASKSYSPIGILLYIRRIVVSINRSEKIKRYLSRILRKRISIRKDHWTV